MYNMKLLETVYKLHITIKQKYNIYYSDELDGVQG